MAFKSSKMKIKKKKYFFCSFNVIMSLYAKNCVCRSNVVANTKTKRKQTLKGPKNVKNRNFEKQKKTFFSHSPKEHI